MAPWKSHLVHAGVGDMKKSWFTPRWRPWDVDVFIAYFILVLFTSLCIWMLCLHVCIYVQHMHACMPGGLRGHKRSQITWNWNYGWFKPPGGFWELNLGPVQERQVLSTTESSLQPWDSVCCCLIGFFLMLKVIYFMWMSVLLTCMFVSCASWNRSEGQFWIDMCALGLEPRSFSRTHALNRQGISPTPTFFF